MPTIRCSRCYTGITTTSEISPKMTCFLCNSCDLRWKEIEGKLKGHSHKDDVRKAFIRFVNDLTNLKNTTLRGLNNVK
jgi:hypothetical protein